MDMFYVALIVFLLCGTVVAVLNYVSDKTKEKNTMFHWERQILHAHALMIEAEENIRRLRDQDLKEVTYHQHYSIRKEVS